MASRSVQCGTKKPPPPRYEPITSSKTSSNYVFQYVNKMYIMHAEVEVESCLVITNCTVVQHRVNGDQAFYGKWRNSTPHRIKTPSLVDMKF